MIRTTAVAVLACLFGAEAAGADAQTRVSGFVDASFGGNLDTKASTFGLDQAELDIVHEIEGKGHVRADIEWVKDGDGWAQDVEQGFLAYAPEPAAGWPFTLGKFNAPIGFELLDAPDMFQFSHSLVFDYGLPTNLIGLMAAGELGRGFDVSAYVVNGWDDNNRPDAGPKTFGGRLGYGFGNMGAVGASAITGRELAESDEDGVDDMLFERTVFDVDLTLTPAQGWLFGAEFNSGQVKTGGVTSKWMGYLVMAHYDVNDWFGLTGRFDSFDDQDGAILDEAMAQVRTSVTFAPTFVLGDGMGALVELRIDSSDEDVFVDADGAASGSTTSAAFEVTYTY
ncbi:porin [bacterium]|nr:porin [bacterium]